MTTSYSRRPLVAGNWKMHGLRKDSSALVLDLANELSRRSPGATSAVDVVVCPPFTALADVRWVLDKADFARLGAQNLHWEDKGAFTGEISGPMLAELGVSYVIVGHSERRQHFAETDETVRRKLAAAGRHGLRPILCVGETLEEREAGSTEARIESQLRGALAAGGASAGGTSGVPAGLAVAYEPIWAIGTGRAAGGEDAERIARLIRAVLADVGGPDLATRTRVLYGGSVKPDNIAEFASQPDIDGALVGGASLKAADFAAIVAAFAR